MLFRSGVLEAEVTGRGLEGDEAVGRRQSEQSGTHKEILIEWEVFFQFTVTGPCLHTALGQGRLGSPLGPGHKNTRCKTRPITLRTALSAITSHHLRERCPRRRRVGATLRRVASERIRRGATMAYGRTTPRSRGMVGSPVHAAEKKVAIATLTAVTGRQQ